MIEMDFLAYSLSAIVAFSGLFVGAFLARSAKSEMPTASRYLPWLQKILVIAVAALFFSHFRVNTALKLIVYAAIIVFLLRAQINFYPFLAVVFFMLGQSPGSLFSVSALVFLCGFPAGSMFIIGTRKRMGRYTVAKALLRKHGIFLLIAIGLQFFYSLLIFRSFG